MMSKSFYLVLAVFWTILTLWLSLASAKTIQALNVFNLWSLDKVAHFGMYFLFSLFWCLGLKGNKYSKLFVIIFSVSFGALMEIFQFYLFNGRSFEIDDIIANTVGTFFGVLFFNYFLK